MAKKTGDKKFYKLFKTILWIKILKDPQKT